MYLIWRESASCFLLYRTVYRLWIGRSKLWASGQDNIKITTTCQRRLFDINPLDSNPSFTLSMLTSHHSDVVGSSPDQFTNTVDLNNANLSTLLYVCPRKHGDLADMSMAAGSLCS
jgi:hypothetical protein